MQDGEPEERGFAGPADLPVRGGDVWRGLISYPVCVLTVPGEMYSFMSAAALTMCGSGQPRIPKDCPDLGIERLAVHA